MHWTEIREMPRTNHLLDVLVESLGLAGIIGIFVSLISLVAGFSPAYMPNFLLHLGFSIIAAVSAQAMARRQHWGALLMLLGVSVFALGSMPLAFFTPLTFLAVVYVLMVVSVYAIEQS